MDPEQQEQESVNENVTHRNSNTDNEYNTSPGINYILYTNSTAKEGNLVINILHRLIKGIWIEKKVPTD
jgi:hypothetical protein